MLSQKDKKTISSQAQRINSTVLVGNNGFTDAEENEFKYALQRDQLIRVKFGLDRNAATEMIRIVRATDPCKCMLHVGFTATFFEARIDS